MLFSLLVISIIGNLYLLNKVYAQNRQLRYQNDDIEYWKLVSEKAKSQYDLMLKWNKSWR